MRRQQLLLRCRVGDSAPQALRRISILIAFLRATQSNSSNPVSLELHSAERLISRTSSSAVLGTSRFLPSSHSSNRNEVGVWEKFFRNKETEENFWNLFSQISLAQICVRRNFRLTFATNGTRKDFIKLVITINPG